MAYNKIIYGSKTLIDLTGDSVIPEKLLNGVKAHDKSGMAITGTFLKGYPTTFNLEDAIQDSFGAFILDSASNKFIGQIIYEKK